MSLVQTGSIADNDTTVFLNTPRRVAINGDYAYVSAYTPDRLQVINVSNPANPTGGISLSNNGTTLMLDGPIDSIIEGNLLYLTEFIGDAIQILDISDPANPVAAGNYPNNGSVRLNGPR